MSFLTPTLHTNAISFTIPGILPGWQRAGKSGKRHYTQSSTANAQAEIAAWAWQAMVGRPLLGGATGVGLVWAVGLPVPASWSPLRRSQALSGHIRPTCKPDFDNLVKHVDCLKGVVWQDDAQITDARELKFYVEQPRTVVRVWEVEVEKPDRWFV